MKACEQTFSAIPHFGLPPKIAVIFTGGGIGL
jgi:hypothetical protein